MNKKYSNTLNNYAEALGLSYDAESLTLYGEFGGYVVILSPIENSYKFTMHLSLKQQGEMPDNKVVKQVIPESKVIGGSMVKGYQVSYILNAGMTGKQGEEKLREAFEMITDFLKANDFVNCCQSSGRTDAEIGIYRIKGVPMILCEESFLDISATALDKVLAQEQKGENFVAGIVGALLGSLIGVATIVILGQLGYVAAISGIIMAVCALKGYEMLGGYLSKKGIIASVLIMIVMVYFGNRLDWAVWSAGYYEDLGVFEAFQILPDLFAEGYLYIEDFYTNLAMVYLFTAIGVIPTVIGILRGRKVKGESYKMNY